MRYGDNLEEMEERERKSGEGDDGSIESTNELRCFFFLQFN